MPDFTAKEIKAFAYHVSACKRRCLVSMDSFPIEFLDAWFLDERIIVEAPGYPSSEKTSGAEGTYRLTAGLYNRGRALLFVGDHSRTVT